MANVIKNSFYAKQYRLCFNQRVRTKVLFTKRNIFISLFQFGAFSSLSFKGYFFSKFIKKILITNNVHIQKHLRAKQATDNQSGVKLISNDRINDLYTLFMSDSGVILFAAMTKILTASATDLGLADIVDCIGWLFLIKQVTLFDTRTLVLSRVKGLFDMYFFSMRRQRRYFLKSSTVVAKNKKKQNKQRSLRISNKQKYKRLRNKKYLLRG